MDGMLNRLWMSMSTLTARFLLDIFCSPGFFALDGFHVLVILKIP